MSRQGRGWRGVSNYRTESLPASFLPGNLLQEAEVFGAEGTHTSSQREAVVKDLGVSPLGPSTQEVELPELLKSVGLLLGTQSLETS